MTKLIITSSAHNLNFVQ